MSRRVSMLVLLFIVVFVSVDLYVKTLNYYYHVEPTPMNNNRFLHYCENCGQSFWMKTPQEKPLNKCMYCYEQE